LPSVNDVNCKDETLYLNESDSYIVKVESPMAELENRLMNSDCLEQITFDELNSSSLLRCTQLDAIVEDVNEETGNEFEEIVQPVR